MFHPRRASLALLIVCGLAACDPPTAPVAAKPKEAPKRPRSSTVVSYERSRHSSGIPLDMQPAKSLAAPSADERVLADALIARVAAAKEKTELQDIIADARQLESQELLRLLDKLLEAKDAEIRALALSLLDGTTAEAVLPTVEKAMRDSDTDVRLMAMQTASQVRSAALRPLLSSALKDPDLAVRQTAFQTGLAQDDATRSALLAEATHSAKEDLVLAGLAVAEATASKPTLVLTMDALDHPNATVRSQAYETLALTLHENFKSRAEALRWWQLNQHRYDEHLVER